MSAARRRRRRRLGFVSLAVALVALVAVAALVVTGRLVIPGVSGLLYPVRYQADIAAVADKYGLDPYLVAAVARTESGFDPEARSHAGAVGLMQLLPKTAEWLTGLDGWKGPDNPALTNPQDSLELGACYLAYLQNTLDSPTAALAAYNAGPTPVRRWVDKAGGGDAFDVDDIPYPETREFVRRVEHYRDLFRKAHPGEFASQVE
jgi:peptidoglycan lytic transglycosylase